MLPLGEGGGEFSSGSMGGRKGGGGDCDGSGEHVEEYGQRELNRRAIKTVMARTVAQ